MTPSELGPSNIDVGYTEGHVGLNLTWEEHDLHTALVLSPDDARRLAYGIEEAADKAEQDE